MNNSLENEDNNNMNSPEYIQWHVNMATEYATSIGLRDDVIAELISYVRELGEGPHSLLGHYDIDDLTQRFMEKKRHNWLLEKRLGKEGVKEKERKDRESYEASMKRLLETTNNDGRVSVKNILNAFKDDFDSDD